jgi:NAD(P)-dependent dehydrogenase (short-subunit alcohol dehydrogenase family)
MWDIKGKTVVITGANSGLGKAASAALAAQGAHIVMICRSPERGRAAQAEIKAESGSDAVDLILADLAVQAEVRRAAEAIMQAYPRLDVLMNNAAVWVNTRKVTPDGIELQLAVNHLAPFLLTNLLRERLVATAAETGEARVVTVSSDAHRFARIRFNDLQSKRLYIGALYYGVTKLMNVLFTRELARRLEGTGVTANALHPGTVNTQLFRFAPLMNALFGGLLRSPQRGAQTQIYLAASPQVSGITGQYFNDEQRIVSPAPPARSDADAARLWRISEGLTGLA